MMPSTFVIGALTVAGLAALAAGRPRIGLALLRAGEAIEARARQDWRQR